MATNYLKGEPIQMRWRSAWCDHEARTIPALFVSQAEMLADYPLYWVKRQGAYRPIKWREVREHVESLAAGLIARGVQPGDRVAILSENRYEWVISDLAILACGAGSVTLHAPLTPAQVQEQLSDAEATVLFVSTAEQAQKVDPARAQLPHLKHFISYDPLSGWTPLDALMEEGRQLLRDKPRVVDEYRETLGWDSLATIIYTSGTTGESKGVMLS
ncbi:MAG: AMP-binding protein, partial [Fimbriimonadales bacterium]|nr:AMP-binding protein [Fimbriimonadales bacterium]